MEYATDDSIIIFYTTFSVETKVNIDDLPNGWRWVGSGLTYPKYNTNTWGGWLGQLYRNIFGPPTKYKYEQQFSGPKESRDEIKEFLDKKLKNFEETGKIRFYHIQNTFLPIPV